MKKIILIAIVMALCSGVLAQTQKVIYTCPMHPEVQMNQPGNCPKCGMNLEKKTLSVAAQKTTPKKPTQKFAPSKQSSNVKKPTSTSGTNSSNSQAKEIAELKKMMEELKIEVAEIKKMLQELKGTSTEAEKTDRDEHKDHERPINNANDTTPVAKVTYTCPMHPEVKSDKPGSCPKCGMKLIKEKTAASGGESSDDENAAMENIMLAKKNLGPIKTITSQIPPRTVVYHLYIRDTTVTFSKKPRRAIAVNGQIPMPTLTFTEGDTAEIWVHNELKELTSLHWHGLFLPNKMDGVPYLTQMPIKPGETYLYKFPIVQHGTHWYHSHSGLQEQIGMYGAFIMNKRKEWDIQTIPVVLSEWTDMKPEEVHRSLHAATDWFAIQKGATQSYSEAINQGRFKTKVLNEWKRMNAMDLTDVYYDNFLINGKNQNIQPQFKAGDKVRLRIANGGASDYFWLSYSGGKITVVATDGNDVEPVEVDRLIIAVSETYDVVVTIPENKSYEFLVTPEDRTKICVYVVRKWRESAGNEIGETKIFCRYADDERYDRYAG